MAPEPIGLLGIPTRLERVTRAASQVVHAVMTIRRQTAAKKTMKTVKVEEDGKD